MMTDHRNVADQPELGTCMSINRQPSSQQMASWKRLGHRLAATALALAGAAFLVVGSAEARVGSAKNFGSRGAKTQTTPPTTNTAPKAAQPVQKSATTAGAAQTAGSAAKSGGFMSKFGGIGGLLAGGLIGAALASMFGLGGGLSAMLGMLLQVALIGGLIYLAISFFRRRSASSTSPAVATASAASGLARTSLAQQPYQQAPAGAFTGTDGTTPLTIGEADFNAFEKMLTEIQTAYGREDEATMRALTTAEMLGYLGEDVNANMDKGVRNELTNVKLLQGDLSEAWSEGDSDYASVAMRYSLLDVTLDRKTGKVISGSHTQPEEVTEFWTFVRPRNASVNAWKLSAIQQS
jgi:predicted lipid-binding transport protein (Tim44 family)